MSILWLEPFIFDPTDSNVFTFQSLNIVIYLNMISIICFVIYCLIYKMDLNLQKPPNSLIIWRMFGECLISVHLLILFLCFAIENNKRKLELTKYIIFFISLLSPLGLFITYFFSGCIAQNLYCTFHNYKNDFDKRMQKYKIYALAGGIIVLFTSILFNSQNTDNTRVKFSMKYYPSWYIGVLYFFGTIIFIFILIKTYFVIKNKTSFFSFMSHNASNDRDAIGHDISTVFISRHLMFCYVFLACFVPNNLVIIMQIFMEVKICNDCRMYSFVIYAISISCAISFVIKITEPYMKKYIKVVFTFMVLKNEMENSGEDYSTLYANNNHNALLFEQREKLTINTIGTNKNFINNNECGIGCDNPNHTKVIEMNDLLLQSENANLNSMADTVEIVTREMQTNNFYKSLISVYLTTIEDYILDQNDFLLQQSHSYIPWDDLIYNEKSRLQLLTNKNLNNPKSLFKPSQDELDDINFLNVKIRKYAPRIFHHFRSIDNISISSFLSSLNPNDNLKIIKASFASGGRSSNPIIFTHDKKLLLKTISKSEKDILIKILPEFHRRMRDCESFLCRIYGLFRIEVLGKQSIHVIVMRNMNELPNETKVCVFDLKGSTVDRTGLTKTDRDLVLSGYKQEVISNYKNKILKDLDFDILGFEFEFDKEICNKIQKSICEDSEFLKGNNLIDYSMLISIHKYRKKDEDNISKDQKFRILKSKNGEYLYNLSIIDFLTEYGITKKFELGFKTAGAMVGENKDTNFSVLDATGYSRRFIRYLNSHIKYEQKE